MAGIEDQYDPERIRRTSSIVRLRTLAGWSAREIAEELGLSERTVVRYRSRLRAAGVCK